MDRQLKAFDIILVDFGQEPIDSEQGGIRPAVIVQTDAGNIHSPTTLVMPFTTKIKHLYQPTHTVIKKGSNKGLVLDSMILGEAMRQISMSSKRVKKYLGRVTDIEEQNKIINVIKSSVILEAMQ